MRNIGSIFTLTLLCCSCMVGPDYQAPQDYTDNIIKHELGLKKSYHIPQNWYCQFGDLQLTSLVQMGLQHSTDIAGAIARLRQARARLHNSEVQFLPMINARAGYTYQKSSKNIGYAQDVDYYTAGFDASWEIDLWGKGRRQTEAAAAQVRQMEYSLNNVKSAVVAEIVANYINLMMNVEKLHIARRNLRLQNDIYETVRAKYESGLVDNIVFNQAKYLVATTKARIPTLESNIEAYKNAISVLIGVLPSILPINTTQRSKLFTQNYQYNKDEIYKLPANIIRLRPDVAAAEQNLIAQNALLGKEVAALYPDVSVTALWGYMSSGGRHLFGSKSQGFSYDPLISLPLLDWNRLQNNVELQKQIKAESLADYQKAVLSAVSELKNAMTAYQNELSANRLQAAALHNMQQVVSSATTRYENGLIEFSDLLNAEQDLLEVQDAYIESRAQTFLNIAAFYKACGGGRLNSD